VTRPPAAVALLLAAAVAVVAGVGCSGDDDDAPAIDASSVSANDALCLDVDRQDRPVVDLIEPAIELAATLYGPDAEFFEISADRQRVSLVVAVDGTASQVFYCGEGGYVPATSLGEASGATFTGDAVDVDVDAVFDQLDEELDDPDIADFAMVGDGDGGVLYDATVQSSAGGVLLVRLSPSGAVLAVQAE
jgi:hypothetical protein